VISIVVPARNAAATITECIRALMGQSTTLEYQIIIVDDHSSDDTVALARHFPAVVLHSQAAGAAAARNTGLAAAAGKIVCFTDADCAPEPGWLEALVAPLADKSVAGAKGVYRTSQRSLVARFVQQEYEDKYRRLARSETINFVDTYSAAYRREILLENGGFDSEFSIVEDQELSFRLASRGYAMIFAPQAAVFHSHPATIARYATKKFRIGYWKAQVVRRFPGRAASDSHTPQVMKLQMALVALAWLALPVAFLWSDAGALATLALALFLLSTLPFMARTLFADPLVAILSPLLLFVRATALTLGFAAGTLYPKSFGSKGMTAIGGNTYLAKRLIDLLAGATGVGALALLLPFLAIAIKLDSEGPVLFRQKRIGHEGRSFTLWKLRSMYADPAETQESEGENSARFPLEPKPENDPRVTSVGRFLRRWSIDELPQLYNVLIGDMSLVGPRPEVPEVVANYTNRQRRRLSAKPGLTGPMQVGGRADLSLDERIALEIDYIEGHSLGRDFKLILKTIPAILRGRGAR